MNIHEGLRIGDYCIDQCFQTFQFKKLTREIYIMYG